MQRIVSKSEFARMCGVTPAAVTKAVAPGCPLHAAEWGGRVDAGHADAEAYLAAKLKSPKRKRARKKAEKAEAAKLKARAKAKPRPKPKAKPAAKKKPTTKDKEPAEGKKRTPRGREAANLSRKQGPPPKAISFLPDDIAKLGDMKFADVVEMFGTDHRMKDWFAGLKALEDLDEKRLKNAKMKGTLISRDLVKKGVLDPIETFHVKLLTDAAKMLASRLHAKIQAGATVQEAESMIKEQVQKFLAPMKRTLAKSLRSNR